MPAKRQVNEEEVIFTFSSKAAKAEVKARAQKAFGEIKGEVKKAIEDIGAQKIVVANEKGKTVLEIPLAAAPIAVAAIGSILTAIAVVVAFWGNCTITVIKKKEEQKAA